MKFKELSDKQKFDVLELIYDEQVYLPDDDGFLFVVPSRTLWDHWKDFVDKSDKLDS